GALGDGVAGPPEETVFPGAGALASFLVGWAVRARSAGVAAEGVPGSGVCGPTAAVAGAAGAPARAGAVALVPLTNCAGAGPAVMLAALSTIAAAGVAGAGAARSAPVPAAGAGLLSRPVNPLAASRSRSLWLPPQPVATSAAAARPMASRRSSRIGLGGRCGGLVGMSVFPPVTVTPT